jgi:cell division protein FtsW
VTVALLVYGLVMVYSASFVESFTDPNIQDGASIFRHQLKLVGIGLVVFVIATAVDYRVWNTIAVWVPWVLVIVLLVFTLVDGNSELGGQRWVDLLGVSFQPSEFAKIALILLVGMLLFKVQENNRRNQSFVLMAIAVIIPIVLILRQPDLGTALIALVGLVAVAWFGEFSMKPIAIAVALIALVVVGTILFTDFRMGRIDAWLNPWEYADAEGYQIVNSLYAFADGGLTGVDLGMSHQKYLYLPQPHNDFIFPIIGEEFGLIGTCVVVVLFVLFLYSAYRIAHNANDLYGRMIVGASASVIGFQAFLNMLCAVNLLPITGKPLPFFSAGGSSIIATLILVGLILNVSLRSGRAVEADQRRDGFLIIEGGRNAARYQDEDPGPVGRVRPGRTFRRQPARAASATAKGPRLRTTPAPARARASGKPASASGGPASAPARASGNPLLNMSPARSRGGSRAFGAPTLRVVRPSGKPTSSGFRTPRKPASGASTASGASSASRNPQPSGFRTPGRATSPGGPKGSRGTSR